MCRIGVGKQSSAWAESRVSRRCYCVRMVRTILLSSILVLCSTTACGPRPAPAAPCKCPADSQDHKHGGHSHSHGDSSPGTDARPAVIAHGGLKSFTNNGNTLVGIATRSQGANSFEVWRSSVAPGGSTPLHKHETEEVFIVLRGQGEVQVGDQVIQFKAPATVIAPAGVPHQLRNTGDEPTDQIVIVGVGSAIYGADGNVLNLPWRQ